MIWGASAALRLPLAVGAAIVFVLVVAAHATLLRLPYYWDEAGYYIPAAYDFFKLGKLIPVSTLTNAHPPLPSIWLAGWWNVFGYAPLTTRIAVACVATIALTGIYCLARNLAGRAAGLVVAALTAIYPIWFAQSTLAQADIFAAAAVMCALAEYAGRARPWVLAALLTLAVLSKETAIITVFVLGVCECVRALTAHGPARRRHWATAAVMFVPLTALLLWYGFHFHETGHIFGNPEYLAYNAKGTMNGPHVLLAFLHRAWHVLGHMGMFLPVLIAIAAWALLEPRIRRGDHASEAVVRISRATAWALFAVAAANLLEFCILGGALLTRYLLPIYPLVLLACVMLWRKYLRWWGLAAAVTAVGFLLALELPAPYSAAPEDNLAYRDFTVLEQQGIAAVLRAQSNPTVLAMWPTTDYLTKPYLGYVTQPVAVVAIPNLRPASVIDAMEQRDYTAALLYSAWDRPSRGGIAPTLMGALDARYLDYKPAMDLASAAYLLHGETIWSAHHKTNAAIALSFPHVIDAKLECGATSIIEPSCRD